MCCVSVNEVCRVRSTIGEDSCLERFFDFQQICMYLSISCTFYHFYLGSLRFIPFTRFCPFIRRRFQLQLASGKWSPRKEKRFKGFKPFKSRHASCIWKSEVPYFPTSVSSR